MGFLEPIQHLFEQGPVFLLVLFRIGSLTLAGPVLGSASIPAKVKILFALALSAAVFGLVPAAPVVVNSWATLTVGVVHELLIGLAMGFMLTLMFQGVQIGAELVSQQMGLSFARLVDPNTQVTTTVLSQFYMLLVTIIYVLMNGHVVLIGSLVQTFKTVPLMGATYSQGMLELMVSVLTGSFALGIRVAGPALAAVFLATLALGFISRTMPQLNILAAGFPLRIALAMVLLVASLGTVGVLFANDLTAMFAVLGRMFA